MDQFDQGSNKEENEEKNVKPFQGIEWGVFENFLLLDFEEVIFVKYGH